MTVVKIINGAVVRCDLSPDCTSVAISVDGNYEACVSTIHSRNRLPNVPRTSSLTRVTLGWGWWLVDEDGSRIHITHPERLTKRRDRAIDEACIAAIDASRRRRMCALALELEAQFGEA